MTDRDGNVVSYTFTIEQTGGSGIVVPGYGFLLNNELTDFGFAPVAGSANPNTGGREAPAEQHGPDDRARRRPAGALGRLPGRLDDPPRRFFRSS